MSDAYVHGYRPRENERLMDQAGTLVDLLHADTSYPAGSTVLEAGCGVGAQTLTLARNSPGARITSVDLSAGSLAQAKARVDAVEVSPRMAYADSSRPDLVDGFTQKTFIAMVEGVRESAIAAGIVEPEAFDAGIRALLRTTEADGVFCYSFFKARGAKAAK